MREGGGVKGKKRHHIDQKFVFLQLLPHAESSIKVTGGWIWISPTLGTCPPSVHAAHTGRPVLSTRA